MEKELNIAIAEQDTADIIKGIAETVAIKASITNKVDKAVGKVLSEEDFTTILKDKLATIEGSHFKGIHKTLIELEAAHPASTLEAGSYAYIKDGASDEVIAMLDGGVWVEYAQGGSVPLTATQIKALYESNVDTNALTDALKDIITGLHGITYTTEVPTDPDYNLQTPHITADVPIRMLQPQNVPTDPAIALASREFMTIGSVIALMNQFQTLVMKYKGTISNMDEITESGFYDGTNVVGSPITGKVIVEAYSDKDGNLDISLKGQDGRRYEGGKPNGGAIHWHNVTPDHLYGTVTPDNADGNDGDIYFQYIV